MGRSVGRPSAECNCAYGETIAPLRLSVIDLLPVKRVSQSVFPQSPKIGKRCLDQYCSIAAYNQFFLRYGRSKRERLHTALLRERLEFFLSRRIYFDNETLLLGKKKCVCSSGVLNVDVCTDCSAL